ncbi:hypothetical protein M2132_001780 [Dysgonomonas sp. PH5-45]|uniref:hypothetical protein n=1 Tax=unclassified Dysgonomonas TaxID=2630389 RepID=UPI0024744B50|nr:MULTISPECIES: hypothetical protein [unclassified Dysgonomonas]MDH6355437.1 hypothetical protein [Dysgonomonas sp. PH5-45]MDH6388334.1 hypothetical protein [Dysgonomonas sp. PH5-37]
MDIKNIVIQLLVNKYKDQKVTVELASKIQKEATEIINNCDKEKPKGTFIKPRI